MKRAIVIGAQGFVGSAFVRCLKQRPLEVIEVTRQSYARHAGTGADVVIQAACNSRKYLADEDPVGEFDSSVRLCLQALKDFPTPLNVHISSADVYADLANPCATSEESPIDAGRISHYGLHKLLAEELVRHYAGRWLIARLAGMVGPGLRKNPVFDVLNDRPLRIHPDSQYQFAATDLVAETVWRLVEAGEANQVFNVCGRGLVSPRQVAELAGRKLDLSLVPSDARPRIMDVNIGKISRRAEVPLSLDTVRAFVAGYPAAKPVPA
ncbi:MAG TPA: NAD(P)-dependent oxidoreductase [Candidatus Acidoferrum sp.]|nr:NAD(P)-dependent oxidoreductase [Candidatus Acidoferrum sp.]